MKRFVLLFVTLMILSQINGCGGESPPTSPAGGGGASEVGESAKHEAKVKAEAEARAAKAAAKSQ